MTQTPIVPAGGRGQGQDATTQLSESTVVFESMGTVISLTTLTEAARLDPDLYARIRGEFALRDHIFSPYRSDSELSLVNSGALSIENTTGAFRNTHARAIAWEERTAGAFRITRPRGGLDLNGIVKAEAMEAATAALRRAGVHDYLLNAGGDIDTGGSLAGRPWSIGLTEPDRSGLVGALSLTGAWRAVATSGAAERGEHIWRRTPRETGPAPLIQVSVVAPEIVTADVAATALMSHGLGAAETIQRWAPIEFLAIRADGTLSATPEMRAWLGGAPKLAL